MKSSADPEDCPYVGLEPFENSHRAYFFGRGRDIKIIAEHVVARPITILYGPSGVGKTSILNVGLSNELPLLADWTIVRLRDWQDPGKLEFRAVDALLNAVERKPRWAPEKTRFAPLVSWVTRKRGLPILLILDQFEEYFLYRDRDRMREIEQIMGSLIARRDVPLRVLVTLRDDAMHQLDQLRGVIPGILDTTIKLDHLRDEDVEDAIRSPIVRYNEDFRKNLAPLLIEEKLPATLIQQLKKADTGLGKGHAYNNAERRIELPYLQLALTKLWEASGGSTASVLREITLVDPTQLGGVQRIVRDHVKLVMSHLTKDEQKLCAKIFDRLVTGIGSKVAYPTEGLAADEVVGADTTKEDVQAVLDKLTTRQARILKPVTIDGMPGFEIFHDVLALPVLEWKRDFQLQTRRREEEQLKEEQLRRGSIWSAAALVLLATVVTVGVSLLNADTIWQWKFNLPGLRDGLRQFVGGFVGGLVAQVATSFRLRSQNNFRFGRGHALALLIGQLIMAFISGLVPILFDAQSFLTSFYIGLSSPLVLDSVVGGILQVPIKDEDDDLKSRQGKIAS